MKFLHLSDLHIGKSVNGFSMLEEQRHVFQQIISYIRGKSPAVVVIAGDVYDRAVPGVEAVRLFDDFLTALAREDVAVMLIAGNHDSAERINYASRLLSDKRLYLCGVPEGNLQPVTLQDEHGSVNFWLLPFIKPSTVRGMYSEKEIDSYTDAVSAVLEAAGIDYSARNVLVSHQFYTSVGITPVLSESEINPVGGLDAIDAGFLERFDYVALGHLHGAQSIGSAHIRYAGSPLKYSFSECKHNKSLTTVELGKKGSLTISTHPLLPLRDMREIKGPLNELISDEIVSQGDKEDYLRVILTDEDEIIDPMGKLRSVYPYVMVLGFENTRQNTQLSTVSIDSEEIDGLSPYDLFSEFFLRTIGSTMSEGQTKIVRELLEASEEEL